MIEAMADRARAPVSRAAGRGPQPDQPDQPKSTGSAGPIGSEAPADSAGPEAPAVPTGVAPAGVRTGVSVATTAERLGLSERQIRRRCQAGFGYGPKTLARILRFRRAVGLARAGAPFAEVAVVTGYADQAHLAREVRALSGAPLGVLTR
jgi:AraC-like DNA-binding protein